MLRTIDLRGSALDAATIRAALPRPADDPGSVQADVVALIDDVRARGEAALLEQADRFDGGRPPAIRVPVEEIVAAERALPPDIRAALEITIERVRAASRAQLSEPTTTHLGDGASILQRWLPVRRVGLYVPGGRAVYPSSVVMNVVPAQVAGVRAIAVATPAQRDQGGRAHPVVLGAAGLLGVHEVYVMGGSGAVGALAHGVPGIGLEPVDVVTGPGNVYVAAAKRAVAGVVGIDSEAGPTEIVVIADDSADPELVAADLISQAEHDVLAAAVLVTDSPSLAAAVDEAVVRRAAATFHADRVRTSLTARQSGILLVDDRAAAVAVSNAYAPEHLEVQTVDPWSLVADLTEAGAVFVGAGTPVSLGDYAAGSNHVLPTGGTARFAAGLSVRPFLRQQQVVDYSLEALRAARPVVRALADAEGLPAHGDAVDARFA
ncbi:histidinol dehydrogenase [Amnibacterium kyonggiense]|uniref:Histidinol dehydrogenase n=1 Tax=Amnibacterium kyonggiense TaxID=595671 RepID=A0A4R7FKZ1_9MICO|nr:histidinol dehydrogenase [Amnibacterium kyonggiense]TDS77036.1 histidinol dehydrogenase [Amnibacterium kyonggiense]